MPQRPAGVITFLFTDIEGSTHLLRDIGPDQYGELLEEHRRLMRQEFSRHGGNEQGTEGDSFLIAFSDPSAAIEAALSAQAALASHPWPEDVRPHVRMGIHSGLASSSADGYVGMALHRGARIAGAGHGDQVLVSQAVFDLVRDVETSYRLIDLGAHRLKDLTEPQHIYQLEPSGPGPVRQFAPLRTLARASTNLPVQPTELIGREEDVRLLTGLLRGEAVRLLTLTGPAGTGKTRLAMQVGAQLIDDFDDGVWLVALGSITDPALVVAAVGAALSLNESAGQSLSAFLSAKRLLLVIDNFEQVMAAAPAISDLMADAPDLKMVVTSREGLRIRGEHVFPVQALHVPDARHLPATGLLGEIPSVALFVERARSANPSFQLTDANAPTVAEICVRLDGLPLAIELCAARIRLLSPDQILKRLADRLTLLTGGARDMPARHQTLRAALEWSHDLLQPAEQTLFARLAVFAGGFTLDAAEAICDAHLDDLSSLVDKSLIRPGDRRFAMLETVREYAAERLMASAEADEIRDRHAAFFEKLAEQAYDERIVAEAERSAELEHELDNLRAALDRLEAVDRERALAMAARLGWFWHVHSHLAEGRLRISNLLFGSTATGVERARALAALGELAAWQADITTARTSIDEAVQTFEEAGLEQDKALALYELGWAFFVAGDDESARNAMEDSLRLQRSLGGELLINRAQLGLLQMLVALGEVDQVEPLAEQSLAASRRLSDRRGEHFAYHFLADSALIRGDSGLALGRYRDALRAAVPLNDRVEICFEVQGVAMSLAGLGHKKQAVRLAAAAAADLEELGLDINSVRFWKELIDRWVGGARAQLEEHAASQLIAEGRSMGMAAAVEEALPS